MIGGTDLGTTNSLVAEWREDAARLVGSPRVVGLDEEGHVLVGKVARE